SSLRPAVQDRAHLQAGCAPDRCVRLSLLDAGHEAVAPQQWQPASSPRLAPIPRRRQAQAPRIPRLHPGRHRLPWTASLPRGRVSPARLELLRVLVAHNSPGHPALRACRRHRATPAPSGISVEYRPNQHLREIHRRTSGHQQDADLPPRRMNQNSGQIPDSQAKRLVRIVSCRVGPGNFTPSRSQIPDVTLSRHPARATESKAAAFRRELELLPSPVGSLPTSVTCPLCSAGITPLHHYYGAVRPCPAHRYFRPRGGDRLRLFPRHRRPGSQVPCESPDESHASYTPDTARPVSRFPPSPSRNWTEAPVSMSPNVFRCLTRGSLALVSLIHT